MYHSIKDVRKIITEADGYQPHSIAPKQGYRGLIENSLVSMKGLAEAAVDAVYKAICGRGTTLMVVKILGGVLCYADTKGTYYTDHQETLFEGGDGYSKVRFISNFPILAMIAGDLLSGNIIIDEISQLEVYKVICGSGTTLMVVNILGGVLCYADTKGTYYIDQQETLLEGGDGFSKVKFISNFPILAMIAGDLLSGNIIIDEISQLFNRAPAINKEEMSCIDVLKSRLRRLARNHAREPDPISATIILEVYKAICGSGTTLMVVKILGGVLCYADTRGTYYTDKQKSLLEGDGYSKVRFISKFPILADLLSGNIIIDEISQLFNRALP